MAADAYTSRRGYLNQTELAEYADITISDADEADDQINQAEELIDAWVGQQDKFVSRDIFGQVSSATASTVTDATTQNSLDQIDDFFKGCEIEIIGGTGIGQRRRISSSDRDTKSLTVSANWTTTPTSSSAFRIYQLGKFPRRGRDVFSAADGSTYYKTIPEAVKRATAAQVEYMINQGAKFFGSDAADMNAERIGDYSYNKGAGGSGGGASALAKLIAPKARALLRGITNRTGRIVPPVTSGL